MIRFTCPFCKKTLQVGEKYAGKGTKCLSCGKPIRIPHPATIPSDKDIDEILRMVDVAPSPKARPKVEPSPWDNPVGGP
jgi:hypothetical protein